VLQIRRQILLHSWHPSCYCVITQTYQLSSLYHFWAIQQLIDNKRKHNPLLWHTSNFLRQKWQQQQYKEAIQYMGGGAVMVLNTTFNNISVPLWWKKPVYMEKTTVLTQVPDKLYHIRIIRIKRYLQFVSVSAPFTHTWTPQKKRLIL
jgi:hypothetical protein